MKFPIEWLSEYTKIKNTTKEIGDIFTYLEFMQDGPVIDDVIDLEIRQNRPDALSIIGLATELSCKTNSKLNYPEQDNSLQFSNPDQLINPKIQGEIKRFMAVKITGVKVGKSPEYIIKRLTQCGIRSVNNAVDITNYVMLEYGIPMHVFDADKLEADCKLTLRMGNEKDELETWLGEKIEINKDDIVIANTENKVVSIGGITGEKHSGAESSTTSIILESANYNQSIIRQSVLIHNLHTDSANRHTKFLPSDLVETAIRRATFLIQKLCGGVVVIAEDYYPEKQVRFDIKLKINEIQRLGGIKVESEIIEKILLNLKYEITAKNAEEFVVKSPRHRTDVKQSVDVVEDILRLVGYENIPLKQLELALPKDQTPKIYKYEDTIRDLLVGMGMDEHITEPLVKNDKNIKRVVLENSLNCEKDSLRISIEETLLPVLSNYTKHKIHNVKIFEIGKIYNTVDNQYSEISTIGGVISANESYKNTKGLLDTLFAKLGIANFYLNRSEDKQIIYLMVEKTQVGFIKYSLQNSIYFEINLEKLIEIPQHTNSEIIIKIPIEHEQIFNLIVNKGLLLRDIEKLISSVKPNDLNTNVITNFIEEYSNTLLESVNKKSYLLSLKIQSLANPVSKEEFKPIKEKILKLLKTRLNIEIKES